MYKNNRMTCFKGRAYQMPIMYLDEFKNPISVAGLTGHWLRVQLQDGTWLERQCVSGISWGYGFDTMYMGIYTFTAEESAEFKLGAYQSVILKLAYGENVFYQELKGYLSVYPDLV